MKKLVTLFGLLAMGVLSATAGQISVDAAKQAGQHFLASRNSGSSAKRFASLTLAYTAVSNARGAQAAQQTAYYYIFNAPSGFVIVAGDDVVTPILGYSTEGQFNPNNIPVNAAKWFEGYKQQIRHAINSGAEATPAVQSEWQNLLKGTQTASIAGAAAVEPLVKTKWDQSPFYNDLCPYDSTEKDRTVTGCVATAMAQVMKFWNYPSKGSGFHSYNHKQYGTLSANFGNTTYNWQAMPDEVKDSNIAVATLMYHCGVSIDMGYNVGSKGGSGAVTLQVAEALKEYFGYSKDIEGLYRKNFTDSAWIATLKAELDNQRPIQYAGTGSGGGHSFVCDGYDANNLFHFNWGWGGSSDGYFSVDKLSPGSLGTGGGDGGFNSNQRAIIGIKPAAAPVLAMRLSDIVTVSASTVNFVAPFTVSANIMNSGNTSFTGDISAAAFDETGKFVDFVEIKQDQTLASGAAFPANLVFSTDGMKSMLPGDYVIRIYFRPAEGNWSVVEDYINFSNYAGIRVVKPSELELFAPMTINPSNGFIQGQPASVALNIKNTGTTTFTGDIGVGLFDLDGELMEVIEQKTESNGLPAGGTYQTPVTFTTSAITADPGTYYVACLYQKTGGELDIVGSTTYPNPITITVALPKLAPDKFESNNKPGDATLLTAAFLGNSAVQNTEGSNCHEGTDYDFYKINLPAGYEYALKPRLHDYYNSGNGNDYSLDALFSYSTDGGTTWSDAYDDTTDAAISMPGGTSVYFYVSPYFTGETGTYLLEIALTRTESSGVNENDIADAINLYPNPAASNVSIDMRNIPGSVWRAELLSLQGRVLVSTDVLSNGIVNLPLSDIAAGVYAVRIHGSEGVFTKKLIVE